MKHHEPPCQPTTPMQNPTREEAEAAIRTLIRNGPATIPTREGLLDTPSPRRAKSYLRNSSAGYEEDPVVHAGTHLRGS